MPLGPPSVSKRQERMMLRASKSKAYAKLRGVKQSVARMFVKADKAKREEK